MVLAGEFKTRDPEVFRQVRERAVPIVAGVLRDAGCRDGTTGSLQGRLVAKSESLDFSEIDEAQAPSFLRRKPMQGKGSA